MRLLNDPVIPDDGDDDAAAAVDDDVDLYSRNYHLPLLARPMRDHLPLNHLQSHTNNSFNFIP